MKNQTHFGDTERMHQIFIAPSDVTLEGLEYLYARFNVCSSISNNNLSLGGKKTRIAWKRGRINCTPQPTSEL